jgi:hypothetical protein
MPNINDIFGLFGDNQPQPQEIHIDFMETPEARIGMFVKLIQNNIVFNQKLKQFFKKVDKEFDEETTQKSSEFTVFNRSWYYIKDIDIDDEKHLYADIEQDTLYLLNALKLSILFFENLEEYEKCAHLHKIEKIVKTF